MIGDRSILEPEFEANKKTSEDTLEAMGLGEMNVVEGKLTEDVKEALGRIDAAIQMATGSEDSKEKIAALLGIRNELISGKIRPEEAGIQADKLGNI